MSAEPLPAPRPAGTDEELKRIWAPPKGWRAVTAVNNTQIGLFYIATALLFFLLAGILALLMRLQLAVPSNTFLDPNTYNQIFTMHGTVMMFLFAVPMVEAIGVLLLPQMLGARDLPFPRLSAYAFWAYFVGGLVFFGTIFVDLAPSSGWFMYPPLSSSKYSPGLGADFWLLGIGFIEISAIAGAIEIIVGILRTRAPGMTLARMPIFAWTMLIFAGMIVFAFPAVILATMLLEMERAFGWPFFIAEKGGDPLLWQHLFWFFGHPEVYIIFLPAAGMVSMMVPTLANTRIVGYSLIVIALIATGFFSLVAGSLYFAYVFSYLYAWTVSPQVWPDLNELLPLSNALLAAVLLIAASAAFMVANRQLRSSPRVGTVTATLLAMSCLGAAFVVQAFDQWNSGLRPETNAYAALTYTASVLQGQLVIALVVMTGFTVARALTGKLDSEHRNVFDNTAVLFHYTVAQSLLGLLLIIGFPILVA